MRYLVVALLAVILTASLPVESAQRSAERDDQWPARSAGVYVAPVTFVAYGDSLTAGASPRFPVELTSNAWPLYSQDAKTLLLGGWARSGADSAEVLAAAVPYSGDVLVVLVGTNDVLNVSYDVGQTMANLELLVATVGIPHVVLAGLPPIPRADEWNAAYQGMAEAHGWLYVDPWASIRADYAPWSLDGIHPNAAGAEVVGLALRAAVSAAGRSAG